MATILVIDDDAAMRRLMARLLGTKHQVIEAANGREGMQMLKQQKPDAVITDILMPQQEGIQTIREIRELSPDTRIIAVSGGGSSGNLMFLDVARAFGADAALAKPFRPAELSTVVEEVLKKSA